MNRLQDLAETLPLNLEDNAEYPNLEFVILDYNSKDGLGEWLKENFSSYIQSGRIAYYRTEEPEFFSMTHSRNIAFKVASGTIVNNLDADNYTYDYWNEPTRPKLCWAEWINMAANICPEKAVFLKSKNFMHGRIGFYKKEFIELLGGYDEQLTGYGEDDLDLLRRAQGLNFHLCRWHDFYTDRIKTLIDAKNTNLKEKHTITRLRNQAQSLANVNAGIFKANEGIVWGKARLIKNFSKEVLV